MKRVVVVGGGIAGLTTALHLQDRAAQVPGGLEVSLLEAGERVGGHVRSEAIDGFLCEWGANGFLDNAPQTLALVWRLGLEGRLVRASAAAARRYLFRHGRLHRLVPHPAAFLTSSVLSLPGRLRLLAEPFVKAASGEVDETVGAFVRRRLGREAGVLADAMVSGVFAGDVDALSLESAFPRLHDLEEEHGSLLKGLIRSRRAARKAAAAKGSPSKKAPTLTSFDAGLEVLTEALAGDLGEVVHRHAEVLSLAHRSGGEGPRWRLRTGAGESWEADAVLLAQSAARAGLLLESLDTVLAREVEAIPTASLAVVALGYDARHLAAAPDGFGFLVPRGEGPRILGCLRESSIFAGRAREGRVLLRAMVGGAHDPEAVDLDDEALLAVVRRDLRTTLGLEADPLFVRLVRHRLGIAQYVAGHGERLARIRWRLHALPGLWLGGSSYEGISLNACVENAGRQAEEILGFLSRIRQPA